MITKVTLIAIFSTNQLFINFKVNYYLCAYLYYYAIFQIEKIRLKAFHVSALGHRPRFQISIANLYKKGCKPETE